MGFYRQTVELHLDAVCCDVDDCDVVLSLSIEEWTRGKTIRYKAIELGWAFDGPWCACPECSKKKCEAA